MTIWKLETRRFKMAINSQGSELCTLWDKSLKKEWMWQPLPGVWNNSATQLFPIVGRLIHGGLWWEEQFLPLSAHGFLRHQSFRCVEKSDVHLVLESSATDATHHLFPWKWKVRTVWVINDIGLDFTQQICNEDSQPFAYSAGWHPGFNLPVATETGWHMQFGFTGLTGPFPTNNRTLQLPDAEMLTTHFPLESESFKDGAVYFGHLEGHQVKVINPTGKAVLTIDTDGYQWLALWGVPGANLLCIEPLAGTTDFPDFDGQICNKHGIHWLSSGESHTRQVKIRFAVDA